MLNRRCKNKIIQMKVLKQTKILNRNKNRIIMNMIKMNFIKAMKKDKFKNYHINKIV